MGETIAEMIEEARRMLAQALSQCGQVHFHDEFADYACAAKSLAETLVLLQQVAANESAQRLTDAIVKKYEDAGETVPVVAVVPGGVS